ncbi:hypothetical protein CYLTODRAFT_426458 [Cylindrobasidium torrendii FP15055 ss-10]|uniref:Uncharacterized protein n=1 Tax=Cylindrobasidium torrendii FP15055 ss-10 TaxID=1314674 RepID=A0A0D7B0I8_9AGAR|nr:hypothetical protein CYLTODRAFT_426458 [Cylindrobasidium torrendii FP15055 ss-10]
MSFQHFRLGAMPMPLPPHLMQQQPTSDSAYTAPTQSTFAANTHVFSSSSGQKLAPAYGTGDDDGYNLTFENLDAFNAWREKEELEQMVEFIKGDTHGSKAVPPRFKDHTKLVCARHARSGRKKYVKKHPERVRKVPSRKLDGIGCPATISFKTYFDKEEVRVCYISQHSHAVGLDNYPFTRRGRRAAREQERDRAIQNKKDNANSNGSDTQQPIASTSFMQSEPETPPEHHMHSPPQHVPQQPHIIQQPTAQYPSMMPQAFQPVPAQPAPQYGYMPQPPPYGVPAMPPPPVDQPMGQDRWQNMQSMFNQLRDQSRTYPFNTASVALLETSLMRLMFECPLAFAPPPHAMVPVAGNPMPMQQDHQDSDSDDSEGSR